MIRFTSNCESQVRPANWGKCISFLFLDFMFKFENWTLVDLFRFNKIIRQAQTKHSPIIRLAWVWSSDTAQVHLHTQVCGLVHRPRVGLASQSLSLKVFLLKIFNWIVILPLFGLEKSPDLVTEDIFNLYLPFA